MKKEMSLPLEKVTPGKEEFAEQALQTVNDLPALLLSSHVNLDGAIDESLARIGRLFTASRAYVMQDEREGKYLRNTHEWVNDRVGPAMFSWPLYDYDYDIPSLKKILNENDVFHGHTVEMPPDLMQVLGKQGVVSYIVAPIMRDGKRCGLVGVDFCDHNQPHAERYSRVVFHLAAVVALALERKQYQLVKKKIAVIKDAVSGIDLPPVEGEEAEDDSATRQAKPLTLLDAERRLIIETLEMYNGNKLKTAKHLGLTWPSLDRRCKKLGIVARRK